MHSRQAASPQLRVGLKLAQAKSSVIRHAVCLDRDRACKVILKCLHRVICKLEGIAAGDAIVDIRAASRGPPGLSGGSVAISLSEGIVYDQNVARRLLEELRKSLRFGLAPVLTEFDHRYNQEKPFWFEKLYEPFLFNRRDKVPQLKE